MKAGDYVYTPRFCYVYIENIYLSQDLLEKAGYTEPTYNQDDYIVLGKSIDMTHMIFCRRAQEEKEMTIEQAQKIVNVSFAWTVVRVIDGDMFTTIICEWKGKRKLIRYSNVLLKISHIEEL